MMNSSNKCLTDGKNAKLGPLNKVTALNPNAAEFVPSAFKSTYGISKSSEVTRLELQGSSKKAAFARSESNTSNNSDDEVHQYWHHQLPDDITSDFEVIGKEELHEPGRLTLSGLSIHDGVEQSKFSASMTNHILDMQQDLSSLTSHKVNSNGKMRYPESIYAKEQSSVVSMTSAANVWNKPFINGEQQGEGHHYDGDYNTGLMDDLIGDSMFLENSFNDPIDFLTAQFPGFAAQSLAEVYYENGCDLNLTIGVLTHLEARLAFLTGDKTLAKELDLKGQLYNMQMKAAHEKAKETIYQKRNPLSPEIHGYRQGQDHLIDLHGLHVTEAIHVLNHELRILRSMARATGQRLYIMIWVGTSNHTKGSRTPARLPLAVEQYLVEEGLRFTQPQPGLLCVVLY